MMHDSEIVHNPNPLVKHLRKPASDFTKNDIMRYIHEKDIQMVNFRYVADDGKLKTLNFVILSRDHLETFLSYGERVDGSSLFSFIEAGSSDLYVIPRFRTAFLNPFEEVPTLEILCSFYTSEGKPLESSPENILKKAHAVFRESTGLEFKAMGELEYYIQSERTEDYPPVDQKGYHNSEPFAKWEHFRKEAMRLISQCGGMIKYGHSEVGNFKTEEWEYEQQEIEFLPVDPEDAIDQLIIAKWILRMLGYRYGVNVSFAPKITVGKAGSGLHFHMLALKEGRNILVQDGKLSDPARKMIAGVLELSGSLTAFGNTNPTSYLRLVPHQEAPTYVCWGDRNRSALVRVPLGWLGGAGEMLRHANPLEPMDHHEMSSKQTFEFRVPDGSANVHLVLAGLLVAVRHGLEMKDALEKADKLYAPGNIHHAGFKARLDQMDQLPASCAESAERLIKDREIYQKDGVFPAGTIDAVIKGLESFGDQNLREKLEKNQGEVSRLVEKFLHWM